MDELTVHMLNAFNDIFHPHVVATTSWKSFKGFTREFVESLFGINGLNLTLRPNEWVTTEACRSDCLSRRRECLRAAEIGAFVDEHSLTKFIILDDVMSGSSLFRNEESYGPVKTRTDLFERAVLVDFEMGLSPRNFTKMLDIAKGEWM